ncbi:hypothetical protein AJ80_00595 [Polytolypa hystricis UAMH7299]|uniref:Uncharacterized protein n=1 Tax=Polytolypa hystricis (strain UAMH7299) TaxID=1447883 RepID=A0A2B7Z4P4_POLH7|nr:hypothetical protein AJ80_00595 [Polytolypa hystricis UAMH7299]
MDPTYARKNRIPINTRLTERFVLPNGKHVRSRGTAMVRWPFADKPGKSYELEFVILPKHEVILGNKFLQETETMTTHRRRIRKVRKLVTSAKEMYLAGEHHARTTGTLDGEPVLALPDSGSEVNIVSKAYSKSRGWKIIGSSSRLQFADSSEQNSLGQVTAMWESGVEEGETMMTFEILSGCPYDVVLGQEYVYGADAYSILIAHDELEHDVPRLCLVIRIPEFLRKRRSGTSGSPSSSEVAAPTAIQEELRRRKAADRDVRDMQEPQRSEERNREMARREAWKLSHLSTEQLASQPSITPSSGNPSCASSS